MTLEDLVESFQGSSLPYNLDNAQTRIGLWFLSLSGNTLDDNKFIVILDFLFTRITFTRVKTVSSWKDKCKVAEFAWVNNTRLILIYSL